jgi:hypothetical protein
MEFSINSCEPGSEHSDFINGRKFLNVCAHIEPRLEREGDLGMVGKDSEGSGRGLMEVLSWHRPGETE